MIVARFATDTSVATRLGGLRTATATPAATPAPAPPGPSLFVERPFRLFAARHAVLVAEFVERFGAGVHVMRRGFIGEAGRCGRLLAATPTAAATAASPTPAPRSAFFGRFRTVAARLVCFAPPFRFPRTAACSAVTAIGPLHVFEPLGAIGSPRRVIEAELPPGRQGGPFAGTWFTAQRRLDRRPWLRLTAAGRPGRLAGRRQAETGIDVVPALRGLRGGRARRLRPGFLPRLLRRELRRRRRRLTARGGAERIGKRGPGIFFVRHGRSVKGRNERA